MNLPRLGVATLALVETLIACEREVSAADLVGTYALVARASGIPWSGDSELDLRGDRRFRQTCARDGSARTIRGAWTWDGRNVTLSEFLDCARVHGDASGVASLIVEASDPPVIVVDPDVNVFYERR